MPNSRPNDDRELAAIAASSAIFSTLPDGEARRRVLSYVLARYLPETPLPADPGAALAPARQAAHGPGQELDGIARLSPSGEFQMTLGELFARSRLTAAVRLAMVAIYAHERLTGRPLSSRRTLTPLLKAWRLYDGNTRSRLAKQRGILRSGDDLALDDQARREAERFIDDIHSSGGIDVGSQRFQHIGPERTAKPEAPIAKVRPAAFFDHIENWDNFTNKCSVGIHTVNKAGIVLWANKTELDLLGYQPEDYVGRFIGEFHQDAEDVSDILGRLTRFETVHNFPARMRAKDGSTKFVIINSNVYRQARGEFGHSRCFTTEIDEAAWQALRDKMDRTGAGSQ